MFPPWSVAGPRNRKPDLPAHNVGENIRGAFHVRRPEQIAGRAVVLVDDVFTTGTTVSECARVLFRAGAATIWVATVARVLKSDATLGLDPDEEVIEGAHVLAAGA